ncbi:hypothetical protein [Micromonospora parathelypteridis]|uniref:Uncharacterized protein n=1 Tax=Micromonospora parathelypteridis TaxID=1839617 RepID=A0A840VFZ6_9ACTN|nr:hypothetical protein [Micromonospora parathelypteridis]MBB5475555.1 hypothetical protein [Micromonospora parathelypteridis]
MLRIMLCGAHDTDRIREDFVKVAAGFGAEVWHYLSGDILYINHGQASWDTNSRDTVRNAHLCVFVVLESYGSITWRTELREALSTGKPILVLCLDRTYQTYQALTRNVALSAVTDPGQQHLIATLREVESERKLTVVSFSYGSFEETLRRHLSRLFELALRQVQVRNSRVALRQIFTDSAGLSAAQLVTTAEIATDEFEEKTLRKQAIHALAAHGAADEDTIVTLLSSMEQGVQRLTVELLPRLYTTRTVDPEFFAHCIALANRSADVGVARRLIPALLDIDLAAAVRALETLELVESGARRRLAETLEAYEPQITDPELVDTVCGLLDRCLTSESEADWKARCRAFHERLTATVPGAAGRPNGIPDQPAHPD